MSVARQNAATIIADARRRSGMTKSAMAEAAGTSRSALDAYESGQRVPGFDTLTRAVAAGGFDLVIALDRSAPDEFDEDASLAAYALNLDIGDPRWVWRSMISDFVSNEFVPASRQQRLRLLATVPAPLSDHRWDAFVAALAEHLAFHAEVPVPEWSLAEERFQLEAFWWPVHGELPSTRSAALAHSPASFKRRRVLIDGRELPRVRS